MSPVESQGKDGCGQPVAIVGNPLVISIGKTAFKVRLYLNYGTAHNMP